MSFELQPRMRDGVVRLEPLVPNDFERLYTVASDPLIWEQHPNKNRYQRKVFETYFEGAVASGGASCVFDDATGTLIGCSRFYDLDESAGTVCIGYTFLARHAWGGPFNRHLKSLMLEHAFRWVHRVIFHVGAGNLRSRRAMEKLGAVNRGELSMSYHGEAASTNVIYEIEKSRWPVGTAS